jgi:Ran-binding protein 1
MMKLYLLYVYFRRRAKLFRYIIGQHDTSPEWKERGIGDVKILKNRAKHSYRLVMRREKTLKVCANHFCKF